MEFSVRFDPGGEAEDIEYKLQGGPWDGGTARFPRTDVPVRITGHSPVGGMAEAFYKPAGEGILMFFEPENQHEPA